MSSPWNGPTATTASTTSSTAPCPPLNGVTPAHIKLKELYARLSNGGVSELVIATNPTLDGDATALLITRQLEGSPFRITRLARGLPIGGSLEHSDETTLSRAFTGRQES